MAYSLLETTVADFEDDVAALPNIKICQVVTLSATDLAVIYETLYTPTTRVSRDRVADQPNTGGADFIHGGQS